MFNVLQLIPAVYRVRKHKRTWNIYKTENGFVINLGKIYIYYNTGQPFHSVATRITDIEGDEYVEKHYTPVRVKILATKKVKFTTRMKKVA